MNRYGIFLFFKMSCNQIMLFQLRYVSWYSFAAYLYIDSAKSLTPDSAKFSCLSFHCCDCASDPLIALNASSLPVFVSHGEMLAHLVPSSDLCLGIAQSYLERKLHITTTQRIFSFWDTALKTLLAIPLFPLPGYAAQT